MGKFAGSQARAIGAEIRRHRDSLGWTLDKLAGATDISRATLSRIETGARRASVDEVASILTAIGVTGPDKQRLIYLAHDESYARVGTGNGIAYQRSAVAAYEAEAIAIYNLQISVVPGLLQTPEYSRMLIGSSPVGSAERERAVFTRVGRQAVLSRPGLGIYQAFIDEAAFRRCAMNPRIMEGQLRHLVEVGNRSTISIRVMPFDAGIYWGCEGAFSLYEFGGGHRVVYHENQNSGLFLDDESTEVYVRLIEALNDAALSAQESYELISDYKEKYANGV